MTTEKTPEKKPEAPKPAPADVAKVRMGGASPDDLKTEQEKGGKDPISPAEPSPGPVKTIEEEGIGARDPYPSKES